MTLSRSFVLALPAILAAAACSSAPEETSQSSAEQLLARGNTAQTIKSVAAHRGITNPLLIAGVANHETNMTHCVADYYVRDCVQTAGTPRSASCRGDSVLVGNADATCDQGGLGLFQIDRGTQEQTIAEAPHVLELDGNVDLGIDHILNDVWQCGETPFFGNDAATALPKTIAWINRATAGTADYDTYFSCITERYNGCSRGCTAATCNCDFNQRKAEYRRDTDALISEFGASYWSAPATTPPPPGPTGCGGLTGGHGLTAGKSVSSCDNRYSLVMQSDENLVLYDRGRAIWASSTNGTGASTAVMQSDGNFVIYDRNERPVWSSRTNGNPGARLALQSDGNLVVYASSNRALWASGTNGR